MSYGNQPAWRHHICGLYYNSQPNLSQIQKIYLPLVELEAHATILATTSRTVLTQTFVNPSDEKGIKQVRYTFPLYDGVSVIGFTCHVGDRTIVGEVKEKEKAKAVFQEAVARGETAGLLEQLPNASDVFSTTVGNVSPGAKVIIKITYLGELKHDMQVDGIRYTIPNIICPRYGSHPGILRTSDSTEACGKSISITVDAEMADGSFIQKMQSPSHPIAMTMGTVSIAPHAEPKMNKASASLTLGAASLETDFVLQIIAKDTGVPKAVLENHPTITNHRALMATLVPKFALPAEKPEIVFICDQSGSMRGERNNLAVQALKVFLRSLPVGVKFNICAFGSNHSFLWPQSMTYSQKSLDEATQHVATFNADYGGTEMLRPLKTTIEQRYKDMPLEVMLLTDGEIWNQQDLFTYLNETVGQSKAPIRLFTLGIGNGVSHALIEGIAKAGNGFSQTVGEGEMMDTKVVRMLKGALSPHVRDFTLEVKYGAASEMEDAEFEIIEKATDSLKVKLDSGNEVKSEVHVFTEFKNMLTLIADNNQKKPISLFDNSVDLEKEETSVNDPTGEARYAYLPKVPIPKIIQAPQNIPALFAFNRTTIYLLLGPDAPSATPKFVMLRGTSTHGPLELEIPIQILDQPGETIHQLAAKKAISELEQGRGWLPEARDSQDRLLKTRFEGRFSDMVECEAVRLGVQFQVGGKWCSFVAVESSERKSSQLETDPKDWEWLEEEETGSLNTSKSFSNLFQVFGHHRDTVVARNIKCWQASIDFRPRVDPFTQFQSQPTNYPTPAPRNVAIPFGQASAATPIAFGSATTVRGSSMGLHMFGGARASTQMASAQSMSPHTQAQPSASALFGNAQAQTAPQMPTQFSNGGLFGGAQPQAVSQRSAQFSGGGLFGSAQAQAAPQISIQSSGGGLFGSSSAAPAPSPADTKALQDYQMGLMTLHQDNKNRKLFTRMANGVPQNEGQPVTLFGGMTPSRAGPPASAGRRLTDVAAENEDHLDATEPCSSGYSPANPIYSPSSPSYSPASPSCSPASPAFASAVSPVFIASASPPTTSPPAQSARCLDTHLARMDNTPTRPTTPPIPSITDQPALFLQHLIALQSFSGAWAWSARLEDAFKKGVGISEAMVRALKAGETDVEIHLLATAVAIAVLEVKLAELQGSWELVVEKARGWLDMQGKQELVERAAALVQGL
ncbi:hypothetical protein J1614_003453 [Plenodomus biglobosus]|nr:hypothetical protein J1614_003453 [Plenodomus biglobosus]